jgi:hypothetical protein
MIARKDRIRRIALAILAGGDAKKPMPQTYGLLEMQVAETLFAEEHPGERTRPMHHPELDVSDKRLFHEIYWDLIVERRITPGSRSNCDDLQSFLLPCEPQSTTPPEPA